MNLIKKYFSPQDLQTITDDIREVEKNTAGELRVEIRQRRDTDERSSSVEQIARKEFVRLGMTKTRDRTGVLIFLLLEDRQFCILADEGIHAMVGQDPWTRLAGDMSADFRKGAYVEGLKRVVREVGDILCAHVPRRSDDSNELPDSVEVR